MKKLDIVVSSASEKEALAQVCSLLHTTAENVALQSQGAGKFSASMLNADEDLEIGRSVDNMEAKVNGHQPPRGNGNRLTLEKISTAFRSAGVEAPPNPELVEQLLKRLEQKQNVVGSVLARGQPAVDGKDGKIELTFETAVLASKIKESGGVDFRERDLAKSVQKGDLLARILPAEKGMPGRDVRGNSISAKDGVPAKIEIGAGVTLAADKIEARAAVSGIVTFNRNTLLVQEVLEIRKDVDFSTGNLRIKFGSMSIRGSIRVGFEVTAGGDITVGESVEDARVEAMGNLSVRQGIVMSGNGLIHVGGNVTAKFAQGATIEAGGDVEINNGIMHCQISAGGRVLATKGVGRIVGGLIRCAGNLEAKELGSDGFIPTEIVIGSLSSHLRELTAEKAKLTLDMHKLEISVGQQNTPEAIARLAPRQRQALQEMIQQMKTMEERTLQLDTEIAEETQRVKSQKSSSIIIQKVIHPGVTLSLGGSVMMVQQPMKNGQYFFDPETQTIQTRPL